MLILCLYFSPWGEKTITQPPSSCPSPLILLSSGASASSLFLDLIMGFAERKKKNPAPGGVTGEENVMLDR